MKYFLAALGLLLLTAVAPADATILAIGTEDITVTLQGSWSIDTTAGRRNATYVRNAFRTTGGGSTTIPNPTRIDLASFTGQTDLWASAYYYFDTNLPVAPAGAAMVEFYDGATERLSVRSAGTAQSLKAAKRNAAGTSTDLATATGSLCGANTLCRIDVHVTYGTSGSIEVFNNGSSILTYSGDVTTDSATTLSKVSFSAHSGTSGGSGFNISEMIVSTTDSRSMHVYACAPAATGATQSWTGVVGNVNPVTINDATFNYTGSSAQLSQWTTGCTTIPSTVAIVDVQQAARVSRGTTGPQTYRWSLHIGASDYDNGANLSLTNSFANYTYDWGALSPATSAPWAASEINSGFSAGLKSAP